ncbi:MAG: hypothetical protein IKB50_01695 [Clostridia bacterium]|nr:hypothetical protein [Clostridia bacterium]
MLKILKANIRETDYPFFTEEELERIYADCNFDINEASYKALIIKAESDKLILSDMTLESSRKYWLSLAALYRKNRTGQMKRGDAS